MSRQAVRFTQLIVSLSWGVKCPEREADHSPVSTDVNAWTYTATASYLFMACKVTTSCYASMASLVYLEAWLMLQQQQ